MAKFGKNIDVLVVVDRSGSLSDYAKDVNNALIGMLKELKNSPDLTGFNVYLTVVSFNNSKEYNVEFKLLQDVSPEDVTIKDFFGQTNPGPVLDEVTTRAMQRYANWKREDSDSVYHPMLFFFTDGNPYPTENFMPIFNEAAAKIKRYEEQSKLIVVPCGFSSDINRENLAKLTNYPEYRICQIASGDVKNLGQFFSKIIPSTTVRAAKLANMDDYDEEYQTELNDAIDDMFGSFFS